MKRNKFLDSVENNQAIALGWLFSVMITNNIFTRIIGFVFVILLIINRFYQIKLKYMILKGGKDGNHCSKKRLRKRTGISLLH